MKKDTDEIIVDLHGSDDASVRKLTEEEQVQMRKLQKELRRELGIEDNSVVVDNGDTQVAVTKPVDMYEALPEEEKPVANITSEKPDENSGEDNIESNQIDTYADNDLQAEEHIETSSQELLDENTQEEHTDNYEKFFKQYSKKDDLADNTNYGKYDSDLDFQLNRKVKKIHLPMPKKLKILITALSAVLVILACVGLGLALYKQPQKVYIMGIAISQPKVDGEYVVEGKYIYDKLSYDNIYLICTYSNGKVTKVPITKSMVTNVEGQVNVDNLFTSAGEVTSTIVYEGKTVKLKHIVEQKNIDSITVIKTDFTITESSVDLNNKLIVVANYTNATSEKLDINECTFEIIEGTGEKHLTNGILNIGSKPNGIHTLVIRYAGKVAKVNVSVNLNK